MKIESKGKIKKVGKKISIYGSEKSKKQQIQSSSDITDPIGKTKHKSDITSSNNTKVQS